VAVQEIVNRAEEIEADIIAWRRDFHAHPELGFQEFRTARIVAETLTELGLEVVTGVGKTGVMAVIGEGTPVIGIRADMDALPIMEANEVEYVSQSPGVMHACGHDSHTAMLLGVALAMAAIYGQVVLNDAMVARYVPPEARTRAYSVRYFLGFTASGLAAPLIAGLSTASGFGLVLGVAAVFGAVIFISAVLFHWLAAPAPASAPAE